MTTPPLSTDPLRPWVVERSFPGPDGCWNLIESAFATRRVILPASYHKAVEIGAPLVTVWDDRHETPDQFDPRPWDVLAIRTHQFLILHCGLYLGRGEFLHAFDEQVGVVITAIDDHRWSRRIAGLLRLRDDR